MCTNVDDKFKIRFNYLTSRLHMGELFVSTTKYIECSPEDQDKAVKGLISLEEQRKIMRLEYKKATGKDMDEKMYANGFES